MAAGTEEFLCLLVMHMDRLYLMGAAQTQSSGVGWVRVDWAFFWVLAFYMKVIQRVVCIFAAHLDYTLQSVFVFKNERPVPAHKRESED